MINKQEKIMTVIISLICRETVSAALKREKKREKCFNNKTVTQWNNERADRRVHK